MDDELARAQSVSAGAGTAKGEVTVEEPSRAAQSLARRTAESRATVPHLELTAEIDMSALSVTEPLAVAARVVRASALALRRVPRANGSYRDGHYALYSRVNVGFAIVAEDVFLAPTVFDADKKLAPEIASELAALTARASTGELTPPELSGATFTVFYPGAYGVMQSSPVINPPQAAALSAGAIRETPIVRDGVILPGQVMVATLACDNRILYGVQAASFLKWIKDLLEDPTSL